MQIMSVWEWREPKAFTVKSNEKYKSINQSNDQSDNFMFILLSLASLTIATTSCSVFGYRKYAAGLQPGIVLYEEYCFGGL